MNPIEEYIQYAIYNLYTGYSINDCGFNIVEPYIEQGYVVGDFIKSDNCNNYYPVYELITSKDFIKSIARGVIKKLTIVDKLDESYEKIDIEGFNKQTKYIYLENKKGVNWFNDIYPRDEEKVLNKIVNEITIKQAIAIRDNKLEEFIINLVIGKITQK